MTEKSNQQKLEQLERLWEKCRHYGMSRRIFLQLLSAGGSAAVLASLAGVASAQDPTPTPTVEATPTPTEEPQQWAKDPEPFIIRGTNLETRLENLEGWITPTHLFFVRNNAPSTPIIDVETYRLRVEGDAIQNPFEFTYADLRSMPSRTVLTCVECAGNQRNLFDLVLGQPAQGGDWLTGGISMGSWTGVPLAHILELAGVQENALQVNIQGLDELAPEQGFQRPMSIEKAMDPNTILAYTMNGEDLPPDHGFPLRAIVPGWVGSNSIKWAGFITVSSEPFWVRNTTSSYVLIGPEWEAPEGSGGDGEPIYEQNIKSALALPWPAELPAGRQRIRGFAQSPHAPIAIVEWSADGGQTWQQANLVSPNLEYSWVRFEFLWDAPEGDQSLMTRATDEAGNTQPDTIPFNEKGYLFNMVYEHPVTVS